MPYIDGELIPLCQYEAEVTFESPDPMASGHDGAGQAVGDAIRGQLFRTLMLECPSDYLDVSWDSARIGPWAVSVPVSLELIRAGDPEEHDTVATEIESAITKTAETLDADVYDVEVRVSELTPTEPEQLIPDPTADEQDQEQDQNQDQEETQ